ncbi:MAG: hypothetical protein IJK18_02740 [Clostridia bacterium]|nr:hypothetical protein [Clostridia bacterium]
MEDFKLYDLDSAELTKLIDISRIKLKEKSSQYKELTEKVVEIIENYPNVLALIEDNEVNSLNEEECKML